MQIDLLKPGQFIVKPFLGDGSDDTKVSGLVVPFHQAQYATHGEVIQTSPLCQDVQPGMVVVFFFAAYEVVYLNFPLTGKVHPVYVLHEKNCFGFFEGW